MTVALLNLFRTFSFRAFRKSYVAVLAAISLTLSVSISSAQVIGPTSVAFSGRPAPAGGTYTNLGPFASLNASGQVVFQGVTSGSGTGLFAGSPGSLQPVAFVGGSAPAGGNYSSFGLTPLINAAGNVAFFAQTTGSGNGLFTGTPGSTLTTVAIDGSAAPIGGTYSAIFSAYLSLNASGQVAFVANTSSSGGGLFVGTSGSVQTVAISGTAAPAGGNFNTLGLFTSLNAPGHIAFWGNTSSSGDGIFSGAPNSLQAIALQGTVAPGGGNYTTIDGTRVSLNEAGQVAFFAGTTATTGLGLFAGSPGSLQVVAQQGSSAPAGGTFSNFIYRTLVLNSSGQVAFTANLTSGSVGLFGGTPGSLQAIALKGALTPEGIGNFDGLPSTPGFTVSALAMNASGQVAFTSSLSGAGVTSANDFGLYAGSAGNLIKIVREGDSIDVDPGTLVDSRIVNSIGFVTNTGGEDGKIMGFNDSGMLVYQLSFTDGSSGIFTSVIPVPEPSTIVLIGFAAAALMGLRRRKAA